ncbi:acyl-CoA N-acyltransferase [Peniophora sp. CONT]|nr:acyl-CoA N-acyltransferase [Peniophora sp. CONT]
MSTTSGVFFDGLTEEEVLAAHRIETEGFPADEAGSLEAFQYRHTHAPELFLGGFEPASAPDAGRTLIAYVNATRSTSDALTHASMSTHEPGGRSACIHAVCVRGDHKRKGIASALLKEYLARLAATNAVDRALLITHEELRPFYEGTGFQWIGPSAVQHGSRPWFEMRWDAPTSALAPSGPSQQQIFEALQASSRKPRATGQLLSEMNGGIAEASLVDEKSGRTRNAHDLLCPRSGCGSVILRKNTASLEQREAVDLDPPTGKSPDLAALPSPPASADWWLVEPSPMEFENIGFSRPVAPTAEGKKQLKLLICADCDLGPLGYSEVGGTQFWLAANRIRYRA